MAKARLRIKLFQVTGPEERTLCSAWTAPGDYDPNDRVQRRGAIQELDRLGGHLKASIRPVG